MEELDRLTAQDVYYARFISEILAHLKMFGANLKPCIYKFRLSNGRVIQGLTVSRAVAKLHVAALINPPGPNFEHG